MKSWVFKEAVCKSVCRGTFLNSVTIASGVGIALAYLVGCYQNIPLCYYALCFNKGSEQELNIVS